MTQTESHNLDKARAAFKAHDRAVIAHLFHDGPAVNDADFGYRHGWIINIGERGYCREECFPNEHHPRFPADQGLSD